MTTMQQCTASQAISKLALIAAHICAWDADAPLVMARAREKCVVDMAATLSLAMTCTQQTTWTDGW
jgi:hypothetical protein